LHVAPESFVGGPLALVATGDEIEIDVANRRIHLHVGEEDLARRRSARRPPEPRYGRGYGAMFSAHIGQADEGCDFDFLQARAAIPEPEFHGPDHPPLVFPRRSRFAPSVIFSKKVRLPIERFAHSGATE